MIQNFFLVLGLILLLIAPVDSFAEEVDDYQTPNPPPKSSKEQVNRLINQKIETFVSRANSGPQMNCDREYLRELILYGFDQNFSDVGNTLRYTSSLDAASETDFFGVVDSSKSIYSGKVPCCIKRVNLDGVMVGIDKIDHFFGNGGILWSKFERGKKKNYAEILQMNVNQESGPWGLAGTGVKSYGDLSANWKGFGFYQELLDGPEPYFTCKDNKLTINKKFDIMKYADDLWSESINCSAFKDSEIAESVASTLKSKGLKCPIDQSKCDAMVKAYSDQPDVSKAIISPVCRKNIPMEKSVETATGYDWDTVKDIAGGLSWGVVKGLFKQIQGGTK